MAENAQIRGVLDTVKKMTVLEVMELVKAMEEEFGVSAQAVMPMMAGQAGAAGAGGAAAVEEKTEFNVVLKSFKAENKVAVIKAIRGITGLGLKEAKDLVEGAPATVKEGVAKDTVADMKKQLEEAGATIEVV